MNGNNLFGLTLSYLKQCFFCFILVLTMASCRHGENDRLLDQAESLIVPMPEKAYELLKDIDPDQLADGSESQARYALLYTRGQYKNSDDAASDSLITLAADYYEEHGDMEQKFYAYLYQGIVRYQLGNFADATVSLYRALANAEHVDSRYPKGLLYTYLALVNGAQNCRDEERYASLAYHEYEAGGMEQYAASALTIWAVAKMHTEDYDSCRLLFDASIHEALCLQNDFVLQEAISGMAQYAILVDSMALAEQLYIDLASDPGYTMTVQDLGNFAIVYANRHLPDSAQACLKRAEQLCQTLNDTIGYYTKAYWTNLYLNDADKATQWKDSLVRYQERLLGETLQNKSLSTLNDYKDWQLSLSERDSQNKTLWIVALAVCLACILMAFLAFYRKKQTQVLLQEQKIRNLQLELKQNAEENTNNLAQLRDEALVNELRNMAARQEVPHVDWAGIDALFAQRLPHFGKALRELSPLSDIEWRVCQLLKLGFSPSQIAQLASRSPEAISSIRRRLYAKVFQKKGSPADWDTFIESL